MAYRVLIADDEQDIRRVLALYLENAGYEVVEAQDGARALQILLTKPVDVCLLDIMMPKLDGYEVIKRVRQSSDVPIIVISAKGQDPQKILGLNLGADDYMVKPFNPLEAVARVNSVLRRAHGRVVTTDARGAQSGADVLRCQDLVLDREACTLTRNGEPIELSGTEWRVMLMLMEHPGRVFTKQQVYECGWGEDYVAADNSVMVCMSKLRAKLGDDGRTYIRTIRGLGYRLQKEAQAQ